MTRGGRDPLEAALRRPGGVDVFSALAAVANVGRSSRYDRRRHAAFAARDYERALAAAPPSVDAWSWARRGRLLSLLGRRAQAARAFTAALAKDRGLAAAHAWAWEAGAQKSFGALDRAIINDARCPVWPAWRGTARLAEARGKSATTAALRDLERSLALDGGFAPALAAAAVAQSRLGRSRAALNLLDEALRRHSREAWLYRLRARLLLAAGEEDGFVRDLEEGLALDEGLGDFAKIFGEMSSYSPSRLAAAADRFLAKRPRVFWMLAFRGDCRRSPEVNDFAGAVRDFEEAVALRPDCPWAWAYLSRARITNASPASALEAIDRAAALAPRCGWIHVWRGELLRRLGRHGMALREFNAGLKADPDYEFGYAWRAGTLRVLGRSAEAVADLTLAIALDPAYAWSLNERSLALRGLGRISEALEDLDAAAARDPKYVWCEDPAARPRALQELDAELRRDPRNARAWSWRGDANIRLGDPGAALADLRHAIALAPRQGGLRALRARALDALGRRREALRELDLAARLSPRPETFLWRGLLKRGLGRLREALSDLRRAARLDRRSAQILFWKGEVELSLGLKRSARRSLSSAVGMDRGNDRARELLRQAYS